MNIKPGLFESLSSKEGQYLSYLIDQYEKSITWEYSKIFEGRVASLNVLLEKEFSDAKDSVDRNISIIKGLFNDLDIMNLHKEELEGIAREMDNLANYLEYIKKMVVGVSVEEIVATEINSFKGQYSKNFKIK